MLDARTRTRTQVWLRSERGLQRAGNIVLANTLLEGVTELIVFERGRTGEILDRYRVPVVDGVPVDGLRRAFKVEELLELADGGKQLVCWRCGVATRDELSVRFRECPDCGYHDDPEDRA